MTESAEEKAAGIAREELAPAHWTEGGPGVAGQTRPDKSRGGGPVAPTDADDTEMDDAAAAHGTWTHLNQRLCEQRMIGNRETS
jgi:hypothetical protein